MDRSAWADIGMAGTTISSEEEDSIIDINPVSQADQNHSTNFMCPQLYQDITKGVLQQFDPPISLKDQLSPQHNTVLHLAASLGHHHLVEPILRHCPDLLSVKNSDGETALHLAAGLGDEPTVRAMLGLEIFNPDILMDENWEKNSALHLAIKNGHYVLAMELVKENPRVFTSPNAENMSPLFMAAQAGKLELVKAMMGIGSVDIKTVEGRSVVHAAIRSRNKEVLKAVLKEESTYFCPYDGQGRSPLSYAASIGCSDGVCYFLENHSSEAIMYKRDRDKDGSFPIHWASKRGHVKIIEQFLKHWPDSKELFNNDGHNILHVAAKNGSANVVSYVLQKPELAMLVNQRDHRYGNTPLHLATKWEQAQVVHIMTWDESVNLEVTNYNGLTALDVAANCPYKTTFQKRLTWLALRYAGARQTHHGNIILDEESYSGRINTLLLVAILIATVTFAAGFTMPGGYDHPGQKGTVATLDKKPMFDLFLLSNTIAMYSSIIVGILLGWAMLNDVRVSLFCLQFAIPLLGISLSTLSLAFLAAIYLLVRNVSWLAALIIVIASISLFLLWILYVPFSFPNSVKYDVYRYILRYPLYILILATQSNKFAKKDAE